MTQIPARRPVLPRPMVLPLGLIPERFDSFVFARVLNQVFKPHLRDGELDFLEGHDVSLRITDAQKRFAVRLQDGAFHGVPAGTAHDLEISGTLYDFLLLAAGREDPDTLFFQRHLSMQGDTGLGVYLKNFLAGVDPGDLNMPAFFHSALAKGLDWYQRLA